MDIKQEFVDNAFAMQAPPPTMPAEDDIHEEWKVVFAAGGKKPQYRMPRDKLLSMHPAIELSIQLGQGSPFQKNMVTINHRPCHVAFKDLRLVTLNDLLVETVHQDCYLVLRTISNPIRGATLLTIVEDHKGFTDFLSLSNINIGLDDNVFLPMDTFVAIRAPYLKFHPSGMYYIQCDHPSDVMKLHPGNSLLKNLLWTDLPIPRAPQSSIPTLKEQAKQLFKDNKYHAASFKLTEAIDHSGLKIGTQIWVELRGDRAASRLKIHQFEGALRDCNKILTHNARDPRAMYLKARTLYALRDFTQCSSVCVGMLKVHPDMISAKTLSKACNQRLEESTHGKYDFLAMQRESYTQRPPRLDHADYIGPVTIIKCRDPPKGSGVFARRDIQQGELLLVEKAFSMVFQNEAEGIPKAFDTVRGKIYGGAEVLLPAQIMQHLQQNPSLANRFLELYSGGREEPPRAITYTGEGWPIIDSFTIASIMDYNIFEAQNELDLMEKPYSASQTEESNSPSTGDCGIWLNCSYLGHSCTANALRTTIGDMMVVRALKPIAKGEEVTIFYGGLFHNYPKRIKRLAKFDIHCECDLCKFQARIAPAEYSARNKAVAAFNNEGSRLVDQGIHSSQVPAARSMLKAIYRTYSTPRFCFDLLDPHTLLFFAQYKGGKLEQCVDDLADAIALFTGSYPLIQTSFEPEVWSREVLLLFFYLCVVLGELNNPMAKNLREKTRALLGVVAGTGTENAPVDYFLRKYADVMHIR